MTALRIFVADDHPIVLDGLRTLIAAQPDMEFAGEAADGLSAVSRTRELQPDVAIIDVSMPRLSGALAVQQLANECPNVKLLALSAHEEPAYARRMLAAGAAGYVVKRAAADDLVRAIRCVAAGEVYVDPAIAGALIAIKRPSSGAAPSELSDREREVLRMVAQGHAIKEIGAALEVSVRTIETYRSRAMEKLALRSRADIVRYAAEHGWLGG
ncbi:MAG TPA: response regulator transcription factor [Polyangiales bacterium]|nr:response regulator transcription factor [Polyangiales bacterium]